MYIIRQTHNEYENLQIILEIQSYCRVQLPTGSGSQVFLLMALPLDSTTDFAIKAISNPIMQSIMMIEVTMSLVTQINELNGGI